MQCRRLSLAERAAFFPWATTLSGQFRTISSLFFSVCVGYAFCRAWCLNRFCLLLGVIAAYSCCCCCFIHTTLSIASCQHPHSPDNHLVHASLVLVTVIMGMVAKTMLFLTISRLCECMNSTCLHRLTLVAHRPLCSVHQYSCRYVIYSYFADLGKTAFAVSGELGGSLLRFSFPNYSQ